MPLFCDSGNCWKAPSELDQIKQIMITIYVNADDCPVKQEIYRVAERHVRKGLANGSLPHSVMAGLVPAIHVFLF